MAQKKTFIQIAIIFGIAALIVLIFWYGSRFASDEEEGFLAEGETFIQRTTAPFNVALFTPEQEQIFRERTSVFSGAAVEINTDEFVDRTTAP